MLAVAGLLQADDAKERIEQLLNEGQQLEETKNWADALAKYQEARKTAQASKLSAEQAEAALASGRMVERASPTDAGSNEAAKLYQEAAQVGTPEQQQVALNNLGTLDLKSRKDKDAVEKFGRIKFDLLAAQDAYTIHYNYAAALDRNGETEKAREQYQQSMNNVASLCGGDSASQGKIGRAHV